MGYFFAAPPPLSLHLVGPEHISPGMASTKFWTSSRTLTAAVSRISIYCFETRLDSGQEDLGGGSYEGHVGRGAAGGHSRGACGVRAASIPVHVQGDLRSSTSALHVTGAWALMVMVDGGSRCCCLLRSYVGVFHNVCCANVYGAYRMCT